MGWCWNLLHVTRRLIRTKLHRNSSTMSKRIAVCQMTSVADKAANLNNVSMLVSSAAKEEVQMIFFPEACDYICDNKEDIVANAEPILTGDIVGKYKELAAKHNVWLSMGGVHEKDEANPNKMYNTHLIIDNEGEIVQAYRKLHLFDVEIPEKKLRLKESDFSHEGGHIVSPVDTPVGKVGMAICYDMRFPELSTSLSILKAEILTFPSAFTQTTGAAHWHVLLRARAIENQCYVIAAAQAGQHNAKRKSYGHALCVDPWGDILADCGEESPCFKIAEISIQKLTDVRRNMPVFNHRRKDVYSLHALSLRKTLLPQHTPNPDPCDEKTAEQECTGPTYAFGHCKVPAACVFYKSVLTFAFVNIRCVTPGHVLVAPIRAAERNEDLSEEEAIDFYRSIRLVQRLMERVHKTRSCTVTIQDGSDAGQTVKVIVIYCLNPSSLKLERIAAFVFFYSLVPFYNKLHR
ncbi:deaminated glutathione amidase [Hyposmocoma kahamanoa]|uniref:deaminated glutathione amidase n=1 Tax=Hyposmocoma kahamanoa TaxID=1477025 RepID=UPI000E6D9FB6|nr:deaminated glutathione amidase [Hyposmocoma kahamanoa]